MPQLNNSLLILRYFLEGAASLEGCCTAAQVSEKALELLGDVDRQFEEMVMRADRLEGALQAIALKDDPQLKLLPDNEPENSEESNVIQLFKMR